MSHKRKTVLLRFARTLTATAFAGVISLLASPEALDWVTRDQALVINFVLIPVLTSMEKAFRYGTEPGEGEVEADDSEIS